MLSYEIFLQAAVPSSNHFRNDEIIIYKANFERSWQQLLQNSIRKGIHRIIDILRQDQSPNGAWDYPFETGIATDCYMIILLRTLGIHEEILIKRLTERILSRQEKSGGWKLFFDEEKENVSATVEAYYALLYSGYYKKSEPRILAAKRNILANGGIQKSHMLTKFMLAVTGQIKWPDFFPLPIEMVLIPESFPLNLYKFSVFGRANLIPIMILANRKSQFKTEMSPDLSELGVLDRFELISFKEWEQLFFMINQGINHMIGIPEQIHQLALEKAKQYMLARIEPDGTFSSYFSSTFLMIFSLLSLGYKKTDPVIINAINGLKKMETEIKGLPHMQYTTATVWNTSLISTAIQNAGISYKDPMIIKANHYLLTRQHVKYGDWVIHNPTGVPGGWGFSDFNTFHPDVDDTTASLRSLSRMVKENPLFLTPWKKGLNWLLSMQNDDGGWPAFERGINGKLLKLWPIEGAEFLIADPSTPDLTGRTLEYLGLYTNLAHEHKAIKNGITWMLRNQEENGSWYGRWGICYLYGTWAAVTGLIAVGLDADHSAIANAVKWLHEVQQDNGGWGESCKSDNARRFVPLGTGTLSHTAWALDALISASDRPTESILKGMSFILNNLEQDDWTTDYPVGQGMAGAFYIHYHSYRYIFPLMALSHYQNKYE